MSIEVVPAIIPRSYHDLEHEMSLVKEYVDFVQVDVMDGEFAPEPSWPYVDDEEGMFYRIASEEEPMPYWKEVNFEVDLMVTEPMAVLDDWINAGAQRIIIHVESNVDVSAAIDHITERSGSVDSFLHTEIGLAFVPSTPVSILEPFMERVDFVQVMGNDKIGYHGVELDETVFDILKELKEKYPDHGRAVDIGVNEETAPGLVEAGATKLVSGSAIFESGDIQGQIQRFRDL